MNGRASPWPVTVLTGMLGSGKTTLIRRLLRHPAMADTLVLVNEFGEVGLDHDLVKAVTDRFVLLANGCLCCTVREDVVRTLRDLRRGWLAGDVPDFGRVLVETTGLAEPAPLIASLLSHPLLADAFELRSVATMVDGQYGLDQLARGPTCRNQICLADVLIMSKGDLADSGTTKTLIGRLAALNPLAVPHAAADVAPGLLFERAAPALSRPAFFCEETADHLAGVSTILLRPARSLAWAAFQVWLHDLLDTCGPRMLRLKGRLRFDAFAASVIVQAVHHTFYPLAEAASGGANFLVIIFDGPIPPGIEAAIERFASLDV